MEFIVSNEKFEGADDYYGLYYSGDVEFNNNKLEILDGEIVKTLNYNDILENTEESKFAGFYNILSFDPLLKTIIIRNDELSTLTLFYYYKNNHLIISNNIWLIITNIEEKNINLNIPVIKSFLQLVRIPDEQGTFFKNIFQLPAASIFKYNLKNNKIEISNYWSLVQTPDNRLSLDDAVYMLDQDLKKLFSYVKNKYPGKTFGFGNSGGLDSRLAPIYAIEASVPVVGFIVGNAKPRGLFYSTSHKNAMAIAKELKFDHHNISYKVNDFENRLLLDIRNNPLSNNQIFKNPYKDLPAFDYMFCGGNGFIVSNDSNKWKAFSKLKNQNEKIEYLIGYINKMRFSTKKEKLHQLILKKANPGKSYFYNNIIREHEDYIRQFYIEFYNKNKEKDNISLIRSFHQSIGNRHSPSGGFESINRLKKSFYLYFPWALQNSLNWPENFFYDRKILKNLLLMKNKKLAKIPDQESKLITGSNKYIDLISTFVRLRGLEYRKWGNSLVIKKEMKKILYRKNPMFNELFKELPNIPILFELHINILFDLLKVKKILDIIYNREFEFITNKSFEIQ